MTTIKSLEGSFELETPRDLDSSFTPEFIKKRQTTIRDNIKSKIIALYSLIQYDSLQQKSAPPTSVLIAPFSALTFTFVPPGDSVNDKFTRNLEHTLR
ncbi:MAG: hypothetical protein OCC45_16070 [Desulfotalea sp.]